MHAGWNLDKKIGVTQLVGIVTVGIVFFSWITAIERKADINTRDIQHVKSELNGINKRFDRLEEKLDRVLERVSR